MNKWLISTIVALLAPICSMGRERIKRKTEQALKISCWIDESIPCEQRGDDEVPVIILNLSEQSIYDVVLALDIIDDKKARHQFNLLYDTATYIANVPPGMYYTLIPWHGKGANTSFNTAISFKDARGKWWNKDAKGRLEESYNSLDRYHVMRPPGDNPIYEYEDRRDR